MKRMISLPGRYVVMMLFMTAGILLQSGLLHALEPIDIVRDGQAGAEIIIQEQAGDVLQNAAQVLQQEIERRTGVKLPVRSAQSGGGVAVIHLGTLKNNEALVRALADLKQESVGADNPGKEGFLLASGMPSGKSSSNGGIIVINGCDDLGMFHGVGWLLRRMDFEGNNATAPPDIIFKTAPASKIRNIRFGDAMGYLSTEPEGWRNIWTDYILGGLGTATFRCDPAHQGDPRVNSTAKYLQERWARQVDLV